MANWKDVLGAGKSVSKLDNLDVSEQTKVTLEAVMCAMAASGKVQEMALIAQTLEKVDTQVDLKSVATNLDRLVNTMQAKEEPRGFTEADMVGLKNENAALHQSILDLREVKPVIK